MTIKGSRAWIGDKEELQICYYALEFRGIKRTKLAEKIRAEVRWPSKPPEIEVLERKVSRYRKQAIDYFEDRPWSMSTLDKHPIPPEAVPAVLACWKELVQSDSILTIREAKWVSRLYSLMADEVHQSFVWRHGTKWLEPETWQNNENKRKSLPGESAQRAKKTASEFSLRVGKGDYGEIECPKCRVRIGIGPTSRTAVCVGCGAQFDIIRISAKAEESDVVRKEISVAKNVPPIIKDINSLIRYAKGYAHLELIYDLIGQPFDSAYMDMLIMGLDKVIPDPHEEGSLLPFLALDIQDFKQFKGKIGRLANERTHNQDG